MSEIPREPVYVTRPALPPLEEFVEYLRKIWDTRILTNNGPFHQQFERELAEYLGVKYLSVFANGTFALVTALQALRITGEVITTPFSFVATTHSLWWNNIKPVFVDIEPEYFNLDPEKIEAAITPQTTAIMPVHVYGNPCRVDEIQKIADTYGLKVIYDAAHAFGVTVNGNSILNYGDLSVLSFHATKTFNTIEGGAIICHDEKTKKRIDFLKNFGFADEVTVVEPGINAKMNEMQAAYGLVQLKYVDEYIAKRKAIAELFRNKLCDVKGIRVLNDIEGIRHSYTYFPILVSELEYGESRDEVYERLKRHNIYGRRYFYPLISQFPTYRGLSSAKPANLTVAVNIAEKVICLPIYPELDFETIEYICNIMKKGKK
jgi:dTDP-4-amino-4,6-dideoxygalactose transaminase